MRKFSVDALRPGMILAKPVMGAEGQLYLNSGVELKYRYIHNLRRTGILFVYISDPLLEDVEVADVITEETRREAVKVLKGMLMANRFDRQGQRKIVLDNRFRPVLEKMVEDVLANKDVVINLSDIRNSDDYTFFHSVNVCTLCLLTGAGMDYSRTSLEELGVGALLHDMGKVCIDDKILNKNGSLTPEEYEEIKRHPALGFEILSQQPSISADSIKVVLQHHERCDGSGYPYKLTREDIHPAARLVMAVDVYDALTADRPYRSSMPPHLAIENISVCAGLYDESMVQHFFRHLAAYPVGTVIRLSNGDLGLVVKNHKGAPLRPVIRICKSGDGYIYDSPYDINLMEKLNLVIVEVLSEKEREVELPLHSSERR
ncbi:MAG: HD-GYP domain-containing protein [Clostridiales bacterium]|jgi:HD-GYP domain-containing protein (c-di-GMP phosphodiesterase class II)|nr:HD-GYP domain-containing protein [Clostridiales bacterium]